MECTGCGFGNVDEAKFCSECGEAMARACSSCGTSIAASAKFCHECGAAAEDASAPVAVAQSASRKQVTALFADLVGSTSFGETVDGEVARTALADYFELLRASVDAHAGTTVKFTGDGLMAVFGLPEVAEDDALRAVAAGREMQRRFVAFAQRVHDRYGVELGLRVGINSGELVVGDGDADLVGDVLNTAARLEAACEPGGVLVGEDTWRLARSAVPFAVAGEVRAKGKAEPVATFSVVDAAAVEADDTPFVGRRAELASLAAVLDDVVQSASPQLAVVVGAPGVGKTRLAAEVRAGAAARTFDIRIERRGSTTFSPVADLVRDAAGGTDPDAIDALVADHPDAGRLAVALGSLLGHSAVRSTQEAFWAVRRLLEILAADHPVVLVVDDIQWAEPLFLDLLEHLAEWTGAPVLLLALARPELREIRPDLTRPGRIVAATVDLEGLDADTTLELAQALLDGDAMPQELVDRLPDSTEGNPLFVRELVRMLVEDGVLERTDVGWRLTVDVEAIDVPPTVLSLLASRVERLPDDEREVLELASVVGTDFDRGSLVALASPTIAGVIGALLDRLRRKDLVHASGAWVGDEPVFRFHHVLLRDAAYRRLLKARRAELHERLAAHIVATGTEGAADETDVVAALHFERAHRFRTELGERGPGVESLAIQAVDRLSRAATQALDRDDLPAAGGYAVRALDLDAGDAYRDELLVLGCEALLSSGDAVGAEALVDELAVRHTDDRLAAWADCFRAQHWTLTAPDRLEEAATLTDAAAARLADLGDQAGVAKARLSRAGALARLGRVGDCEGELDQALTAARDADDRRRIAAVLGATPQAALWGPSPAARAGGRCLDVLRLLHITVASPSVEATSYRCQGVLEALRGRFDSARAKLETSATTSRELGLRQGVLETELYSGMVELLADDSAGAEKHLRAAAAGLGDLGIGADAGRARALLALALLEGGQVDEAEHLAETARASAGQNLQTAIASAAALARVRSAQERHDEAEALVGEAIERASSTDIVLDHALALAAGQRVAEASGDAALARSRRASARMLIEEKGSRHWIGVSLDRADDVANRRRPDESSASTDWFAELHDQLHAAIAAGTRDDLLRLTSEDLVVVDHRLAGFASMARDEWIDDQFTRSAGYRAEFEVLAETPAFGIAETGIITAGGDEWRLLAVVEARGDRLCRMEFFDVDEREAAFRRFRELDGESGRASAAWEALFGRLEAVWEPFDDEGMGSLLTDDFTWLDHRPASTGRLDRAGYLAFVATHPPEEKLRLLGVRASSDVAILFDHQALLGDDNERRVLMLMEREGDRLRRIEVMGLEQGELARMRFDEVRRGAAATPNTAFRVAERSADCFSRGDFVAARALLTEDFIERRIGGEFLDVGELDADQVIAQMAGAGANGETRAQVELELLATRGDDLCLHRVTLHTDGTIVRMLAVTSQRGGLMASGTQFDIDSLDEAFAELDRLGGEFGLWDEWVDSVVTLFDGADRRDRQTMRAVMRDDLVMVDHRHASLGRLDADEYADLLAVDVPGRTGQCLEIVKKSERAALLHLDLEEADGRTWRFLALYAQDADHRLYRAETFEVEQRAEAIARFEELAGGSGLPDIGANNAWLVAEEIAKRATDGDIEGAARLFLDDARVERRGLTDGGPMTVAEYAAGLSAVFEQPGFEFVERELLATRGDELVLFRHHVRWNGGEFDRVGVIEVDGERVSRLIWFPDDDGLEAARIELDRRDDERLGLGDDGWSRVGPAFTESLSTLNETLLRRHLTDDFRFEDRRSISLGVFEREQFVDLQMQRGRTDGFFVEQFAKSRRALVALSAIRELDGGAEWRFLQVWERAGDRVRRMLAFDLDQRDEAMAAFREIEEGAAPPVLVEPNAAWRVAERGLAAWLRGDLEDLRAWLAESFTSRRAVDLDVGEVDKEQYLALGAGYFDEGLESIEAELIATRSERLCAVRHVDHFRTGVNSRLVVFELDESGLVVAAVSFEEDDLYTALQELDERALRLGSSRRQFEAAEALGVAIGTLDADAFVPLFADDFEFVDHRPAGLGRHDRDRYIQLQLDRSAGTTVYDVEWPRMTDRLAVYNIMVRSPDGIEWRMLQIHELDDAGRFTRMETFDIADRADVLQRFDELEAAHRVAEMGEPTNAAVQLGQRVLDAIRGGMSGEERFRRFCEDDVVWSDRTWSLTELRGEDVTLNQDFLLGEGVVRLDNETVAVRGDHLALSRLSWEMEDGSFAESLMMVELGPTGKMGTLTSFETNQLDDALDEIDARFWAWLDLPEVGHIFGRTRRALSSGDVEPLSDFYDFDGRFVDHRPLGFGSMMIGELLRAVASTDGYESYVPEILRWDDGIVLFHSRGATAEGAGWDTLQLLIDSGGRTISWEMWAADQRSEALARFEEVAPAAADNPADGPMHELIAAVAQSDTDRPAPATAVTNRASEYFRQGARLVFDDDVDLREFLEDDYVFRNRVTIDVDLRGDRTDTQWQFVADELDDVEVDTVAVRGEDLALMRTRENWSGDLPGESLLLVEIGSTGKVRSHTLFETSRLDDALDGLDRLWAEHDPAAGGWAELSIEDRARVREARDGWSSFRPDAILVDHRPLGFGQITGAEFGRMRSSVPGYVNYIASIEVVDGDVALFIMRAESADSSAWESRTIVVRDGGDLVSADMFGLDDRVAAQARFDELLAGAEPVDRIDT